MTYNKSIPTYVFNRWKRVNPKYNINFSYDKDCISFLEKNFNNFVSSKFKTIKKGMYKADLWRLCKLYIEGGIYADVDLVPFINIDKLDKNVTFYSCLSIDTKSIFQAFIVNNCKPKNPLILCFILSFLCNNPYTYKNGPTYDMYNCIKYNLNNIQILPDIKYRINEIKMPFFLSKSKLNSKKINLYYFPKNINYNIRLLTIESKIKFDYKIANNILTVTRIDKNTGWDKNYIIEIYIKTNQTIYLFKENIGSSNNYTTSYVTYKGTKILNSRDQVYYKNNGW